MSEGTKLGEFNDSQEFKSSMDESAGGAETLKGTKIGDLSDFEKSLLKDIPEDQKMEEKSEENLEEKVEDVVEEKTEEKAEEKTNEEVVVEEVLSSEPKQDEQADVAPVTTEIPAAEEISAEIKDIPEQESEQAPVQEKQEEDTQKSFFEQELDRLDVDIEEGDIVEGTVRSVEKSGVLVDIGFKSDGFIANEEFSNDPRVTPKGTLKAGDKVTACIEKLETKQGYTKLSRKKAEYEMGWNDMIELSRSKDVIEVIIMSKVQGGLVSEYMGIKGFIPASHVIKEADSNLDEFVRQRLNVVVLKADRERRKVIFSHKMAQSKKSRKDIDKILEGLDIGQILDGKVSSIKDFGAFVDIGGLEGLVHISELSWSRIRHPKDVLTEGQEVKVFVLGVDKENGRVSLGMKQLEKDPWDKVEEKYAIGQEVKGVVSRCVAFGAFVTLEDHLEGLIHISELSTDHVESVNQIVNVGDEVTVTVIKVMSDEQKIGLSLKPQQDETQDETQESAQDSSEQVTEEVSEVSTEEAVQEVVEVEEAPEAASDTVSEDISPETNEEQSDSQSNEEKKEAVEEVQ